ncbi:MAG: hypothetical protein FWC64_13110, partial [Treponema sp.]|nr:hypothetical protein [Treponema sp.]
MAHARRGIIGGLRRTSAPGITAGHCRAAFAAFVIPPVAAYTCTMAKTTAPEKPAAPPSKERIAWH